MGIYRLLCFIVFLSISFSNQSLAQDTLNIKRTNNKVIISGESYYIHIVKRGETLYRIAKAYNATVDAIERHNFNIKAEGLNIGQPVKIPVKSKSTQTIEKQSVPKIHVVDSGETTYSIAREYHLSLKQMYALNPKAKKTIYPGQKLFLPQTPDTSTVKILSDDDYIYHILKKDETLYALSKKYGVKTRRIERSNDNIDTDNLQPGQVIKIPKTRVKVRPQKPNQTDTSFYFYNVKSGETLFAIMQRFNIDKKIVYQHNPQLKDRELLAGEFLKFPHSQISLPQKTQQDSTAAPHARRSGTFIKDTCQCPSNGGSKQIQVALMLPLYSYTNDTLNRNTTYPKLYPRSKIFLEFYEGVLLAIDNLRKKGLAIDLHVYDTQNDTNVVKQQISQDIFPYFDLIIGPVYGQNLPIVTNRAKAFNIPVISPLSTENQFLKNYKFGFQISPTEKILIQKSLTQIKKIDADNYIIIKNGNKPEEDFINQFKTNFFKGKTMAEISHLGYAEVTYYAGDEDLNLDPFVDSLHNLVIVPSSDKAFVSDVVSRLNTLNEDYEITLFGHPRLINYENIDIKFFHHLNTHIFNLNYIDYDKKEVNNFIYKFRKFFEKEPEKYAFYGYDISNYFLHAYQLFGEQFYCCFNQYYPDMLQMDFDFQQSSPQSGFINEKMLILNFQRNYLLQPVEPKQ